MVIFHSYVNVYQAGYSGNDWETHVDHGSMMKYEGMKGTRVLYTAEKVIPLRIRAS